MTQKLFSARQAAELVGKVPSRIRQICIASHRDDEKPIGTNVDGTWILSNRDIARIRRLPDHRRREFRTLKEI